MSISTTLTKTAILTFGKYVVGTKLFNNILDQVKSYEATALSSAQKKAGVLGKLETIGVTASESLVNLGIELALKYIRTK